MKGNTENGKGEGEGGGMKGNIENRKGRGRRE